MKTHFAMGDGSTLCGLPVAQPKRKLTTAAHVRSTTCENCLRVAMGRQETARSGQRAGGRVKRK